MQVHIPPSLVHAHACVNIHPESSPFPSRLLPSSPHPTPPLTCPPQAKVQGGLSPRPLLSVPHILADESSCYYHG